MKPHFSVASLVLCLALACTAQLSFTPALLAQTAQQSAPVPWASASEVNGLLLQLESAAQTTSADLSHVRIDKWKTDNGSKREAQANADSVTRNLQTALPELINALRSSPESLPATFKLYRNLDAVYDVMSTLAESAGAFGSKNDFQALSNDFNSLDRIRRGIADRMENLSTSKEAEIARLHTQMKAAQAAANAAPPKKVIVDDEEKPTKSTHKKKTAKPASSGAPAPSPTNTSKQR